MVGLERGIFSSFDEVVCEFKTFKKHPIGCLLKRIRGLLKGVSHTS